MLEPIHIPQLKRRSEQTETLQFDEIIPELETLTPVQGWIQVAHRGNYLEVSAKATTIVTLTCHRCLQQYNYRLTIIPSELIWLDDAADQRPGILLDQEIASDDLVESLSPQGDFDPATWLYEQLCLEIPQRQLCSQDCAGIQVPEAASKPSTDRRWASLERLKNQL